MQKSGISPTTQNRILSDASIEEMFTNQIPKFPDFGRNGIYLLPNPTSQTRYRNCIRSRRSSRRDGPSVSDSRYLDFAQRANVACLMPEEGTSAKIKSCLGFMLTDREGATGRGQNTAWWAGLAIWSWWCDREMGIVGMCANPEVMGLWAKMEGMVYTNLEQGSKELHIR
ncbi:MAG: hypothetical protein Q9185_000051 [Variospora sp. 1 TL-2023]